MGLYFGLLGRSAHGKTAMKFLNFWHFLKYLQGKSFIVQLSKDDVPAPDTLRSNVEANPNDAGARRRLGAHLLTIGELDAAYSELLEAISLLSQDQNAEDDSCGQAGRTLTGDRRLADRAMARYFAAKTLEQMGRDAEAREHWQGCADDWRSAVPDEKYLPGIPYYTEATTKLYS